MSLSLTFLGAAKNVTGSRHLIEADGVRVLLDCGLYQERQNAARNWDEFAVPPPSIEAVVLTHAHIDHSGWLPRLVRHGFRGLVYCSLATAEMVPLVLADAARLQAEDVAWKRKRHAAEGRASLYPPQPLYDEDDVEATSHSLRGVAFGVPQSVAPGLTATLLPSGHILGASMVLIEQIATGKRLLFSGDLGCPGRPLMPEPTAPPKADLVVIESTYGDRVHDESVDLATQLADQVNATIRRGGSLLIPCFAVERAQELLYHLQKLLRSNRIPKVPVFLDSPMAVSLLKVYGNHPEALDAQARGRLALGDSPFAFPELHLCASRDQSKRINDVNRPSIIIAGSGMCTGGRIKHHLSRYLDDPTSTLLFVGYQASGTLGRQLLDGAGEVRLFGEFRRVGLQVRQIHGFSGHADQRQLLQWLGQTPDGPKRVAVVHGGAGVTTSFAQLVRQRFGCEVVVPEYGQRVVLPDN
ncbi:MAG TPA: MBL fold metallo-hydrolase [Polyangiaceae bacterium]|nr:MBL fold metallo-hydrolase [Polyangiaceae bacterium]